MYSIRSLIYEGNLNSIPPTDEQKWLLLTPFMFGIVVYNSKGVL